MENIDLGAIYDVIKKGIEWIEDSGIIAKIPQYVDKALDLIGQYLPKVIDFITGAIGKLG